MSVKYFDQIIGSDIPLRKLNLTDQLQREYKHVKKLFCDFVRLYNTGVISLNEDGKKNLFVLHNMWKKASFHQDLNYFFAMKEHHLYLNHLDCEIWREYIDCFMKWRMSMMAHCDNNALLVS